MGAWKFLTADTQGIKRIGAIGTPFKPVLLRFRQLLTPFVLAPHCTHLPSGWISADLHYSAR